MVIVSWIFLMPCTFHAESIFLWQVGRKICRKEGWSGYRYISCYMLLDKISYMKEKNDLHTTCPFPSFYLLTVMDLPTFSKPFNWKKFVYKSQLIIALSRKNRDCPFQRLGWLGPMSPFIYSRNYCSLVQSLYFIYTKHYVVK